MGEGETVTGLGGIGERRGDTSLTQGEVESNCGGWESTTGETGESLGECVDSSTISNWMGMSECVLMEGGGGSVEMLQSVIGTGEGAGDGGGLSCIDGVGEGAKGMSNFGVILSISFAMGLGDSSVVLGGGSMMGVVQISKEGGTV